MNKYMEKAIETAQAAAECGEIPVGAVIVRGGEIIAEASNTVEKENCPLCHAEINAIAHAAKICGKYLDDCDMYVTVEPCAMCTGAIINARLKRLYIGAAEPNMGCCGSRYDLVTANPLCANMEVYYGIGESSAKKLMKDFFEKLRLRNNSQNDNKS